MDVLENGGARWRRRKWGRILEKRSYCADETRGKVVDKAIHRGGQSAVERLTGHRDKGLFEPSRATRMRAEFAGLSYQSTKKMDITFVEDIMGTVTEFPDCASYVSLSANFRKSLYAHAIGTYCDEGGKVFFLDPNMGEVSFPDRRSFQNWWTKEARPAWQNDDNYAYFNTCRITRMHGLSELDRVQRLTGWITKEVAPPPKSPWEEGESSGDAFDIRLSGGSFGTRAEMGDDDLDEALKAELEYQESRFDDDGLFDELREK